MNALRKKDKAIYNSSKKFFSEEGGESESISGVQKRKPKLFKDLVRDQVLNKIEGNSDEISSDEEAKTHREANISKEEKLAKLAYNEEQVALRTAFLVDSDDDEGGDNDTDSWLKKKNKTSCNSAQEREREEEICDLAKLSDGSKLLDPHGEIKDGDNFLLDFIRNKRWVDRDLLDNEVLDENSDGSLNDLERMENFESKYNFRFEEAMNEDRGTSGAGLSVVGYARTALSDTIRRKDDSRKLKRQQRKERKAAERRAKEEQLKRLKNAKREELEERIGQIKGALGEKNDENDLNEEVIMKLMQGDYDPEKFESMMSKMYDEDFYEKEDTEWKTDADVKETLKEVGKENPNDDIFDDIEHGEGGLYDEPYGGMESHDEYEEQGEEDEGEDVEDVEFMEQDQLNEEKETPLEKKLKDRMMDELYKLDYEDIIGDLKTRFKYRPVKANAYGLNTEEILFARDTTLKQFVSLKKMAPYDEGEEYVPGTKKRKRFREMNKKDFKEMELEEQKADDNINEKRVSEGETPKKKRRRQKKGTKQIKSTFGNLAVNATLEEVGEARKNDGDKVSNESKKARKKKGKKMKKGIEKSKKKSKRERKMENHTSTNKSKVISDTRLASYDI